LKVSKPTHVGGAIVPVTVTMYGSTNAPRAVNLASNSPFAPVPMTVDIPAASLTATVNIASLATSVDRTVQVSGEFEGVTRSVTFYLLAPRPANLEFFPDSVIGGQNTLGTVTISSTAPIGGFVVHLSSDGPEAHVPTQATVAVGGTQKNFTANTLAVATITVRTISATANGVTKTHTLQVNP
jgi:hypothetical protein